MIEKSMVTFLGSLVSPAVRAFYQHLQDAPPSKFAWFRRSGDEALDTIDGSGDPEIIYFDVELYASTLDDMTALASALRAKRDYRGALGSGTVEDIQVQDQQDDYEPQASGDSLPPFSAAFRVVVTLYEE